MFAVSVVCLFGSRIIKENVLFIQKAAGKVYQEQKEKRKWKEMGKLMNG